MENLNQFLPHGFCISWSPNLLWTYLISDSLIFLAYFAIPPVLFYFARKRSDTSLDTLLLLFAAFIFACGLTHLMGVVTLWKPVFYLDAGLKAVTAAISVATVIYLWPRIPQLASLPSPDQLMKLNSQLAAEVADRKKYETELLTAKETAEIANQAKSRFIANMSHEIRTPMNAIIGLSRLAMNKQVTPEVLEYLQKINTASQSLLGILNDILDISKMEAGKLRMESTSFNLDVLTGNLYHMFSVGAENKHLNFELETASDVPKLLVGDAMRLQQILANLLGNAIKFTEKGTVSLIIGLKRKEESQALISFRVTDTGIGISQHHLEHLFQPFTQADSSITRRFGGSGLGLSISRNLLQLMGSDLHVTSQPGIGTSFSFDLLLGFALLADEASPADARADASPVPLQTSRPLAGARILVAEDNLINQEVVCEFLQLSGAEVALANNGQEAIDLLIAQATDGQRPFDAVLMDVHMPVMEGVEATQQIRSLPQFDHLPVIALTAGVTQEERDRCLNHGMNDFIPKPIEPDGLIATLTYWIRHLNKTVDKETEVNSNNNTTGFNLGNIPAFDFKNLLSIYSGDEARVVKLLHKFREHHLDTLKTLDGLVSAGQYKDAELIVHGLKGESGNLGAFDLHEKAVVLDAELKQNRMDPETYRAFSQAFSSVLENIDKLQ